MHTLESVKTARHVVTSAFAALKARDYLALAELCDPISLLSFKTEMVEEFCGKYRADDNDETSSTLRTIELTEEQYSEFCQCFDPVRLLKAEFPDLSTVEELSALEPVNLFATWLKGKSYDRFLDDLVSKEPWRQDSLKKCPDSWPDYQIIGCVYDSPDIAYVLYRNRLSAADAAEGYNDWLASAPAAHREFMTAMHHRGDPILVTCRRQSDASWRLVAKRHFMLFGSLEVIELHHDE